MISNLNLLIPVEYDIYPHVVDFYRTALKLAAHSNGMSTKGNPWHCFQALALCNRRGLADCRLYAVNDRVI